MAKSILAHFMDSFYNLYGPPLFWNEMDERSKAVSLATTLVAVELRIGSVFHCWILEE